MVSQIVMDKARFKIQVVYFLRLKSLCLAASPKYPKIIQGYKLEYDKHYIELLFIILNG